MQNRKLQSVMSLRNQLYDARSLALCCEFSCVDMDELKKMVENFETMLCQLSKDDFISVWKINGLEFQSTRPFSVKFCSALRRKGHAIFQCLAFVRSDCVSSVYGAKRSLSSVEVNSLIGIESNVSADYPELWHNVFPNGRCETGELVKRLHLLFQGGARPFLNQYGTCDSIASFSAMPHNNDPDRYYGSMSYEVCVSCLGDNTQYFAVELAKCLKHIGESCSKVNGRVMLQPRPYLRPGGSPHMEYFSRFPDFDGSHNETNCLEHEWYHSYYMCGVEWCNLISRRTGTLIPTLKDSTKLSSGISADNLISGATMLYSNKDILCFGLEELRNMKTFVYPALYPGHLDFTPGRMFKNAESNMFCFAPGANLANIAIFEDEIVLKASNYILFQHKG